MVQLLWKMVLQSLKELNTELAQDPASLPLVIHPKEIKETICVLHPCSEQHYEQSNGRSHPGVYKHK